MAMSARVNRMNGRIIGEKRSGVTRRFSHDPQGNTVAVYNTSGTQTDSFVYWPYGEVRVRTGTSTIPYQYSGAWGSYTDSSGRNYNVYRYLRKDYGRWMTVDPLWPEEDEYVYVRSSPTSLVDPEGGQAQPVPIKPPPPRRELPPGWRIEPGGRNGRPGTSVPPRGQPPVPQVMPPMFNDPIMLPIDIGRFLSDLCFGPKPLQPPIPAPATVTVPAPTLNQCQAIHTEYKRICGSLAARCAEGMECSELKKALGLSSQCARLRHMITICDIFPPHGWVPNKCGHLGEHCKAAKATCNCIKIARGRAGRQRNTTCAWATNGRFDRMCKESCEFCSAAAKACSPKGDFPKWNCAHPV